MRKLLLKTSLSLICLFDHVHMIWLMPLVMAALYLESIFLWESERSPKARLILSILYTVIETGRLKPHPS